MYWVLLTVNVRSCAQLNIQNTTSITKYFLKFIQFIDVQRITRI